MEMNSEIGPTVKPYIEVFSRLNDMGNCIGPNGMLLFLINNNKYCQPTSTTKVYNFIKHLNR